MIECPYCHKVVKSHIRETKPNIGCVSRIRVCSNCHRSYRTHESLETWTREQGWIQYAVINPKPAEASEA